MGLIWLATNGRVLRLVDQQRMRPLDLPQRNQACGNSDLQISAAILAHDAIALDGASALV
jgi:hypothetical protein